MITLVCHRGDARRFAEAASGWGVDQVSDGPVPWYVMAKFPITTLPMVIVECPEHPYEVLGVAYGEADMRRMAENPPACQNRFDRGTLGKAAVLPSGRSSIWIPGKSYREG